MPLRLPRAYLPRAEYCVYSLRLCRALSMGKTVVRQDSALRAGM